MMVICKAGDLIRSISYTGAAVSATLNSTSYLSQSIIAVWILEWDNIQKQQSQSVHRVDFIGSQRWKSTADGIVTAHQMKLGPISKSMH
jgi:hypothetical protein